MTPAITTQHGHDSGVSDLARGDPGADLLPASLVRDAAERVTARLDPDLLQYGVEQGDAGVREALVELLEGEGAGSGPPERLFVTAGASLALHLVCGLFTEPGDRVLVADPTYHLALAQFRDHRLRVEAVASDTDGIDPDALDAALRSSRASLLYLVPAFGNPTGSTLPPARQEEVAEVAARHDLLVVADEVYRLTGFDHVPRSLAGIADARVLSLNSVSKVLSPGLRLGWIDGPEEDLARIARSGVLRSGGGMNPFTAALVAEAVGSGALRDHIARLRVLLRERHDALASALRSELPEAQFRSVAGGYFLWVRVPGFAVGAPEARESLREKGVKVAPASSFSPTSADGTVSGSEQTSQSMRLCFAHATPDGLREGVRRLAAAVRDART